MAGAVVDKTKNMISSIGAMQTLVENFPMSFISAGDLKFSTSFDVLSILFKIFGVDRKELIDKLTDALCGGMKDRSDGSGFIAQAEEIVKMALEANIINLLNCTTNPIISNKLLDATDGGYKNYETSGEGITLDVAELDFTGVLSRSPFLDSGSKFYFDVEDKTPNNLYTSKDFNAFLWYIINKSDKSQNTERVWDNRYRAAIYGDGNGKHKEIIRCTYIDDNYPQTDKIRVQLCGSNYYKTRKLGKKDGTKWALNKTIFEFNHEFLSSIKLYEPKVIVAEIVEYLLGTGNLTVNLGFSVNEEIVQGKVQEIINKVIGTSDTEINDCYFTFSNDEYNDMLEKSEKNRYNIINTGNGYVEADPNSILDKLGNITTTSSLVEDKTVISETLTETIVNPAQDPSGTMTGDFTYDWQFELLRMLAYPLIRPLFTPKVIFLLLVNQKIMGSLEDLVLDFNAILETLYKVLFVVIKDIIIKLKDLLIDLFLSWLMEKIKPLIELFAAKLLMETLQMYKDLLMQLLDACVFGWGKNNQLVGVIDNVNYADIIPSTQTEPNQSTC